jgi:dolichol-phosphate mannosyltransferase
MIRFSFTFNDATKSFQACRRTTLPGLRPFVSSHFNATIELPLKTPSWRKHS